MMKKALTNIRRYTLAALVAACTAAACTTGDDSNFLDVEDIADPGDDNLPKATEIGANTAGGYLEVRTPSASRRQPWILNYKGSYLSAKTAATIEIVQDSLRLTIPGSVQQPYPTTMDVVFTIPNHRIDSLSGLQALSNSGFHMSERKLRVAVSPQRPIGLTNNNPVAVKEATLGFSRCRRIYRNQGELVGVSVAGKFSLHGVAADTINVSLDNGRFDLFFTSRDGSGVFK